MATVEVEWGLQDVRSERGKMGRAIRRRCSALGLSGQHHEHRSARWVEAGQGRGKRRESGGVCRVEGGWGRVGGVEGKGQVSTISGESRVRMVVVEGEGGGLKMRKEASVAVSRGSKRIRWC